MSIAAELFVLFGMTPDRGSFKEGMGLLQGLRTAAHRLIGVEAVKDLVGFVEHAAKAGTEILGMATSVGLSTDAFQSWSYVAKRAGSNAKQFVTSVGMFERNLREFAAGRGGDRFKSAMSAVGISASTASAALAGPDGVNTALYHVANAYKAMGNTGNRAAINMVLFGARAKGMAQDLSQGGDALRKQIAHLHDIGGVVDDQSLKNLKELNNGIVDMKTSFSALALQAVGTVAPALAEMAEGAAKWIAANRDLISGAIEAAVTALGYAFQVVAGIVSWLGDTIKAVFSGDDDGATAILIGIAVAVMSIVVPALYAMAVAAWASLGPYVLIAAGVAAIAFLIIKLIKHWDEVKKAAKDFAVWLIGGFAFWKDTLYDAFVQPWIDAWDKVKELAHDAWEYVVNLDWEAVPILGALVKLGHKLGRGLNPGGAEGRDNTSDDMGGAAREVMPDGSVVWHDAAPASATPGTGNGAGSTVNITAPLTVNMNGVKDGDQAVEGFEDALQKHMRHAFSGTGGGETQ